MKKTNKDQVEPAVEPEITRIVLEQVVMTSELFRQEDVGWKEITDQQVVDMLRGWLEMDYAGQFFIEIIQHPASVGRWLMRMTAKPMEEGPSEQV